MAFLEVNELCKTFQGQSVLKGATLAVEKGELMALIGPSGCGKTTLMRSIAGFEHVDGGSILLDGEDVTDWKPNRRKVGMMFQDYSLWPHMTIFRNVAFGLEQQKLPAAEKKAQVMDALERVKMADYAERKPRELSGGQAQRVALARALVLKPACLLLDEPFSNLDPKLSQRMRDEVSEVCRQYALTTIYVTHNQEEALEMADRVSLLLDGVIQQIAEPVSIYKRPYNLQVAEFIGESNFIPGEVVRAAAGEALVKTSFGEFHGALADLSYELTEGVKVMLSIRPEALRLDLYPADENCVSGQIRSVKYRGASAVYEITVGENCINVLEANPRFVNGCEGRDFHIWVNPEDVVVLPV